MSNSERCGQGSAIQSKGFLIAMLALVFAVCVCSLGAPASNADDDTDWYFVDNGIEYWITSDTNRTVEVIGYQGSIGNLTIPSKLNHTGIEYTVTSIGEDAFYECSILTSVTIPDSVSIIDRNAFYKCTELTSVTIANGVQDIGMDAFRGCIGLTSFTIPESLSSIGYFAFHECSALREFIVDENNPYFKGDLGVLFTKDGEELLQCPNGKNGAYTIPDTVKVIGNGAFRNCVGLTSVTIPEGVTTIDVYAFNGCIGLASIDIPCSVTNIDIYAFNDCTNLTEITVDDENPTYENKGGVLFTKDGDCLYIYPNGKDGAYTIPEGTKAIGSNSFRGSPNLSSVTIPGSVTTIGNNAFNYCTGLTTVTIPGSVIKIKSSTFGFCTGLTSVVISDGITDVGPYAFEGCTELVSVDMPATVTTIGSNAFRGCVKLSSITLPDELVSIGSHAFYRCAGLTDITIPANVWNIQFGAFEECTGLTAINLKEGNENYVAVDGVLFTADMFELVQYPCGKVGQYTIPEGVCSIDRRVFNGCVGLTTITIPNTAPYDDYLYFRGCSSLTDIFVSEGFNGGNTVSIDGMLYSKDTKTIIRCPEGKTGSITLPDTVYRIDTCAFESTKLIEIVICDGDTLRIGTDAFKDCNPDLRIVSGKAGFDLETYKDVAMTERVGIDDLSDGFYGTIYLKWMESPVEDSSDVLVFGITVGVVFASITLSALLVFIRRKV